MRKNRLIRSQFPGQSAVTEHEPEETETPEESEVVAEEPAEMEDENEKIRISVLRRIFLMERKQSRPR